MKLDIKVVNINGRYHARLMGDGKVLDEMACSLKIDISWICREMLRWYDKCGGISEFASRARERQISQPTGRVWYNNQLDM